MYALIEATTKSETAIQVRYVKVESVSENLVALTWDSAEQDIGVSSAQFASPSSTTNVDFVMDEEKRGGRQGNVAYYRIKRYIKTAPANFTLKTSNAPKVTITDLVENTEYIFEIRPFVGSKGWGEWSEPRSAKTSPRLPNPAE